MNYFTHRIFSRSALITAAFLLFWVAPESQAQSRFLNSLKKKGSELVGKASGRERQNSGTANSSASKSTGNPDKPNNTKNDFNKEDITSLQAINAAWLEPIGFASPKGELSPAFKLPAITSSETEQMQYVQRRPLPQDMTNQALLDEYLALQDWTKRAEASQMVISIKDEFGSRSYLLDQELTVRAATLEGYVEAREYLEKEALDEVPGSFLPKRGITDLAKTLESDEYKRIIKSSAEPLRRYLREKPKKWFDDHGGLANVNSRAKWVPTTGGLYASSGSSGSIGISTDGKTASGVVQADGRILVDGMFFKAYPRGKYAVLEATNPQYMKGRDVVIPAYIESEGVKCAVTTIETHAFQDNGIKSVEIPNTVIAIRQLAFSGNALTKVVLPSSLKELGPSCFAGDTSLREVVIPESLEDLGGYAFQYCASLTSVTLPRKIGKIGAYAFAECTALTTVEMPDVVAFYELGDRVFYNCKMLKSVTIPRGITIIGDDAFAGCKSLTSVVVPEGVTMIKNGAFDGCTALKSVTLPTHSLETIDNRAFVDCASLTSITLPASVKKYGMTIFQGCTSLRSVTMPRRFETDPTLNRKLISIFLKSGIYDNTKGVKMDCINFVD